MEDDLKFLKMVDQNIFVQWKMIPFFWTIEDKFVKIKQANKIMTKKNSF